MLKFHSNPSKCCQKQIEPNMHQFAIQRRKQIINIIYSPVERLFYDMDFHCIWCCFECFRVVIRPGLVCNEMKVRCFDLDRNAQCDRNSMCNGSRLCKPFVIPSENSMHNKRFEYMKYNYAICSKFFASMWNSTHCHYYFMPFFLQRTCFIPFFFLLKLQHKLFKY